MQISLGAGRLLARQGRSASPRDGQEEGRGHGQGEGRLPRRREEQGGRRQDRRARLRSDGEVRRLRLQPQSHSAAYGLLTYQTAYLKRYFPRRVLRGAADLRQGRHRQRREVHRRGAAMGIAVLRPDINESRHGLHGRATDARERQAKKVIRFGLGAVKGVGEGAVEAILEARARRRAVPSLFDFCRRVDTQRCNRKVLEALSRRARSTACRANASPRAAVRGARRGARARRRGAARSRERPDQPVRRCSPAAEPAKAGAAPAGRDVSRARASGCPKQLLAFEKESLGFYITGHPLDRYRGDLQRYATRDDERLRGRREVAGRALDRRHRQPVPRDDHEEGRQDGALHARGCRAARSR